MKTNGGKSKKLGAVLIALGALIVITVIASLAKKDQPIVNRDSLATAWSNSLRLRMALRKRTGRETIPSLRLTYRRLTAGMRFWRIMILRVRIFGSLAKLRTLAKT